MPTSKHRKKHKQKVQARKTEVQENKNAYQRAMNNHITRLVMEAEAKKAAETALTPAADNTAFTVDAESEDVTGN